MRITVNGESYKTENDGTVQELLNELRIVSDRVAVEVNLSIIKKSDYGGYRLKEGDTVEIVSFVGGG